jgi:hypothetical protein
MDPTEESAMTEASGLVDDQVMPEQSRSSPSFDSRQLVKRAAEDLRKMTLAAPLPSLFAAFLLGVLVARRR